ncbi:hypothetical protein PC9H_009884 [Pleurotus ostreatus]|uniref:Protein F37C4.5 n=1 Tax=Pleurotus ostreatus TaxID=5322 RepID=A0A8H6ZRI1_PLEOS|nr:uncharacterized protein PC9H_009884 [Pleurotus ostreatus]KAF7424576.1 hypothetical protein PC9H_009884 [Pleurotus ostreatus]KAJ8692462.1 hypothetical protein PTI98_009772 [Pleurotus ostreatus]
MPYTMNISASDYPIKSVKVYKSKAEIVRRFKLELKSDQNKIEIVNLPSDVVRDSVRVSGLANARLYDVVCTIRTSRDAEDTVLESIRLLQVKKVELEGQKNVRQAEADLLVSWAKGVTAEHVAYGDMPAFLQNFVSQGKDNLEAVTNISEEIITIDRQIQRLKDEKELRKGSTNAKVVVVIGAQGQQSVSFDLTYAVTNASWSPTYELHASMEVGQPTTLHYRAQVTQSTGEDWVDAPLTLSVTGTGGISHTIPTLLPLKIRPAFKPVGGNQFSAPPPFGLSMAQSNAPQPAVFGQSSNLFGTPAAPQAPSAGLFGSAAHPTQAFGASGGRDKAVPASRSEAELQEYVDINPFGDDIPSEPSKPTTVASESPLSISFAIEGQTTIPTDGLKHQVPIAILPVGVEFSHIAVPRIRPAVYIQCRVTNTSEYRWLAGNVSVILEGNHVSSVYIQGVSVGKSFDCTLGVDSAMKVNYEKKSVVSKTAERSFAEQISIATCTTKVTISNSHKYDVPRLLVRECLPLSSPDQEVKVVLKSPAELADAKDKEEVEVRDGLKVMWSPVVDGKGGEKDGMFEWRSSVKAGGEIILDANWEVRTPNGKWVEYSDPQWAQ